MKKMAWRKIVQIVFIIYVNLSVTKSQFSFEPFSYEVLVNRTDFTDTFAIQTYTSCTGLQLYGQLKCCSCDKDCYKDLSCCLDKDWVGSHALINKQYENIVNKTELYRNYYDCEYLLPHPKQKDYGVTMIKTCLLEPTNTTDKLLCLQDQNHTTSWEQVWPVYDTDGHLFRNQFCARCNFVQNYTYLSMKANCEDTLFLNNNKSVSYTGFITDMQSCKFTYEYDGKDVLRTQPCVPPICSKGHRFYDLCLSYSSPMSNGDILFRNYHCYLCYKEQQKIDVAPLSRGCAEMTQLCTDNQRCDLPNGKESSRTVTTFNLHLQQGNAKISNFIQNFPERKFLNISKEYVFPFDAGLEQYLCKKRNIRTQCCDCEADCIRTHTCCIDMLWNETNPIPLESYLNNFISEALSYKPVICSEVFPNAYMFNHKSEKRLMVATCLHESSEELKQLCYQNSTIIKPVVGIDGYLYANEGCAICNAVHDFKPINISVTCQNVDPNIDKIFANQSNGLDLITHMTGCVFGIAGDSIIMPAKIHNTGKYGTTCDKDINAYNTTCDISNSNYDLCKSYKAPLLNNYQNYHCWACNTQNPDVSNMGIKYCGCGDGDCIVVPTALPYMGWSLLISFSGSTTLKGSNVDQLYESSCENGTIFNILSGKCEGFFCPQNYEKTSSGCTQRNTKSVNISDANFDSCLLAKPKVFFRFNKGILLNSSDVLLIKSLLNTTSEFYYFYDDKNASVFCYNGNITNNTLYQFESPLILTIPSLQEIIITSNDQISINSLYQLNLSHYFENGYVCSDPKVQSIEQSNFSSSCLFNNQSSLQIIRLTKFSIDRSVVTCSHFHLTPSCPLQQLTANTSLDSNKTLKYTNEDGKSIYYTVNQYFPLNDGYGVCINTTNIIYRVDPGWLLNLRKAEYYISLVGIPISIICYLWIILRFITLKEYYTIPQQCVVGMCIFLLLSDVFFLIAIEERQNEMLCHAISILMHWTLLVSFMWTLIISFDLVMKFRVLSATSGSELNKRRKLIYRYLISISLPTLIVIITVLLDETSTLQVNYGTQQICWINYLYARVGAYIIPIAVTFCITLGSITYTLNIVHTTAKQSEARLKDTKRHKISIIKIAYKLIVILGVSECIGFIQITNPNDNELKFSAACAFIYSVLRSFRGLMLWFVYISGTVYDQYKKYYNKYRLESSSAILTKSEMMTKSESKSTTSTPLSTRSLVLKNDVFLKNVTRKCSAQL